MADMANILGLSSPSQISRYENGQNLPDICAISKIALALEVDLNWLITGEKGVLMNQSGTIT
jgi:Helix-turn-helix.